MQAQVSLTPPPLTKLCQPVPELPVRDVQQAQRHYCEKLGAEDVQATYGEMQSRGTNIVDPLEKKPWGITQFTVADLDGNIFYVHGD